MTKEFAAQVLICGAGAAGLTLAVDLARRGVSFRLIEKMDGPFRGSRGKGIQPRTQEIFEDLGIIDRIVAAGARAQSALALKKPERRAGLLAGDRAPDAPIRGAAGQPTRLFQLFKGVHWTLLGYDVERDAMAPRPGLHIHTVGPRDDIFDEDGYLRDVYGLTSGDWGLVRPDGYIGAIVSCGEVEALETYLRTVGLEQGLV